MPAASETEREIRACIERFLSEVRELVHRRALEAVRARFEADPGAPEAPGARLELAAQGPPRPRRSRAHPASPAEGRIAELVLEYVALHPGIALADLRSGLGMSNEELRPPLSRLLEQGRLRTVGQRRGTRYLPAGDHPPGRASTPSSQPRSSPERPTKTRSSAGAPRLGAPASTAEPEPAATPPPGQGAPAGRALREPPAGGSRVAREPASRPASYPAPHSTIEPELAGAGSERT